MQLSILNRTDLEFQRLEAEFYQPRFLEAKKMAGSAGLFQFDVKVLHPAEVKRVYSENGTLQIVLAQNVRDNIMDWSTVKKMDISVKPLIARNELKEGDVLVTRSGANYGQTSVITIEPKELGLYACADVLVLKPGEIGGPLLSTYLNTEIGKLLMVRGVYGAGQPHVSPSYINKIPFPSHLLQIKEHVKEIIYESREKQKLSKDLYRQATQLLDEALGLNNIQFKKEKSYKTTASGIILGRRADAEYFNPKLRQYWDYLGTNSNYDLVPITEFCTVLKFGNPDYASNGTPIITQKHLSDISPENFGKDPIAANSWTIKYPGAVLRENDLLFYSVGAYLGKTNIWFREETAVPASFITLLRAFSSSDAGYLMVLLNSKYGILQSKVFQSGTSQQYIYPKDIRQFKVPSIPQELREELYDLIKKSYQSKKKSDLLLEQAKNEVETLIEQAAHQS